MIPAPPVQGRGNVKERGLRAVGSAHTKGSVFWKQMLGYVWRGVDLTYCWAIAAFRHPSPLPSTLGKPGSAGGVRSIQVGIPRGVMKKR